MFRASLAPIIRSMTTVYAAPGTSCTRGCIYSCHTPDDGCKRRPKPVEWSRSEIKITTQLHRVGLFNNNIKSIWPVSGLMVRTKWLWIKVGYNNN